ncbi:uncharacterized protein LOC120284087 [Dioscorea cayenensis subsp. rotundata]|uniref:Uncharacterized protein LOC120284087 n=1 Tax=Dioscorea cayennensis subsp. rotundata TaxID=55577 RepID=A0AB40D7S7_DIOCR|nr:uncharacterized protein LOC120284087 [Dioscorea cayenensis subsp. rotundata]
MEIKDKRGTKNVVADHLSRLEQCGGQEPASKEINDFFLEEHLYAVQSSESKDTPWFTDFANYLSGIVLKQGLTFQQKKKFFSDLKNYFWEDPYLFHICADMWLEDVYQGKKVTTSLHIVIPGHEEMMRNTNAIVRNLEHHIAQMSKIIEERLPDSLPSNTEINPKESLKLYAKFLKELITNKRKLDELSSETLSEEYSALITNKLPKKEKDLGGFVIFYIIGGLINEKALANLGASINLTPYRIFEKLILGEPKPTTITLQLVDRSIRQPRGIIEDVFVKVDKFIFPVDIVILDVDDKVEGKHSKILEDESLEADAPDDLVDEVYCQELVVARVPLIQE